MKVVFFTSKHNLLASANRPRCNQNIQGLLQKTFVFILNETMRQNSQQSVKNFWQQFNILEAVRIIGDSLDAISQKTLNGVWKKMSSFFFKSETEVTPETDQVARTIEEVVSLVRQLDLEVDSDEMLDLSVSCWTHIACLLYTSRCV